MARKKTDTEHSDQTESDQTDGQTPMGDQDADADAVAVSAKTQEHADDGRAEGSKSKVEADPEQSAEDPSDNNPVPVDTPEDGSDTIASATVHHVAEVDDHVGEHGSFPTWVKVAIILLFGATIALWGGPRLATVLPSGLEPVARFLTPGSVRQAAEIDARLTALETAGPAAAPLSEAAIEAAVQAQISAALDSADAGALTENVSELKSEISALQDAITAMGGSDLEARLTAAETQLTGLDAQIGSLTSQVTEAIAQGLAEQGQMSAEQAATYQANIERLKAEIGQIASLQGAIDHKVEELAATNARLSKEAEEIAERAEAETKQIVNAAQITTALSEMTAAVESGAPFRAALDILSAAAPDQDLSRLQAVADKGAVPLKELQVAFPTLAHAALRASMRTDASGVLGSAFGYVKSHFATRSLKPLPGTGTNAVLSRMDDALGKGDLGAVMDEAQGLSDAARAPLAGWLDQAAELAETQAGVAALSANFANLKN